MFNLRAVVSCGFLDTPTKGNQEAVNYFAGSNVTFSCGDGYRLEGSESRICQDDGVWSGQETRCVGTYRIPCLDLKFVLGIEYDVM